MKQLLIITMLAFGCVSANAQLKASYSDGVLTVNGVRYELALVEAGTFTMGAGADSLNQHVARWESPAHKVTISKDFYMGKTEVTQALWTAVMGSNPSEDKGDNRPVEGVSWNYCQTFIERLNAITGKHFRLPTEAEWEFAARGGNLSKHYQYSGSNNIDEVAWYHKNSNKMSHPVAEKLPNELGLYDMTGNVMEWCQDRYDDLTHAPQTDPTGAEEGDCRVVRGGDYFSGIAETCHTSCRGNDLPELGVANRGLRLVLSESPTTAPREEQLPAPDIMVSGTTLLVNSIPYELVKVEAGTFTMGAMAGDAEAQDWEKPAHKVTITKDFYIGQIEVTQALWKAVMGSNPSRGYRSNNYAVENVSWEDCQDFISRLNAATGRKFRLPTEAEWEFAARGGNLSEHYLYSGSNNVDDVACYYNSYDNGPNRVAMTEPNELDIYDMSGNVFEWCQDWEGKYSSNAQTDPTGPDTGTFRVKRGGAWTYTADGCRNSSRTSNYPNYRENNLGLRLVLSE